MALFVRNGGSRHTGQAAPPQRNIQIVDKHETGKSKRISPLFIMPEHRNKGIAQRAIELAEEIHGSSDWELVTILQEEGNCHLYEKMGYHQTGETVVVNERMTLVVYIK